MRQFGFGCGMFHYTLRLLFPAFLVDKDSSSPLAEENPASSQMHEDFPMIILGFSGAISVAIVLVTLSTILVFRWRRKSPRRRMIPSSSHGGTTGAANDKITGKEQEFNSLGDGETEPNMPGGSSQSLVDLRSTDRYDGKGDDAPGEHLCW